MHVRPVQVDVKSVELSNDKAIAEADLKRCLGTLRWALMPRACSGGSKGDGSRGPTPIVRGHPSNQDARSLVCDA